MLLRCLAVPNCVCSARTSENHFRMSSGAARHLAHRGVSSFAKWLSAFGEALDWPGGETCRTRGHRRTARAPGLARRVVGKIRPLSFGQPAPGSPTKVPLRLAYEGGGQPQDTGRTPVRSPLSPCLAWQGRGTPPTTGTGSPSKSREQASASRDAVDAPAEGNTAIGRHP